jgi:signal transduction histidine kinase
VNWHRRLVQEAVALANATIGQKFGGLGLGLALSRATAEILGRSISAASDGPGRGSSFTVKLPLANKRLKP